MNALPTTYERKTGNLMKEIHRQHNETLYRITKHYTHSPAELTRQLSGFYHKSGYHWSLHKEVNATIANSLLNTVIPHTLQIATTECVCKAISPDKNLAVPFNDILLGNIPEC